MAITPERKNAAVVARDMRTRVQASTGLTSMSSDSKTRVLLDLTAEQVIESRSRMLEALYSRQISTASGVHLDAIGVDLGVARLPEVRCQALDSERSFGFYVASGIMGDINGGLSFPIAAGTTVWSNPNQNEFGSRIEYRVVNTVTVQPGDTLVYVTVEAVAVGSGSRVGSGVLVNHNVSNIVSPSQLLCTNFYPVINGRNIETHEAYRFRLSANYDRLISSNEGKIRLESIRVPGVIDVRVLSGYYGVGTVAVAVLGADYTSSPRLIEGVQAKLNATKGPSSIAQAIPATAVYLDVDLQVEVGRPVSVVEQRQIEVIIRRAIFGYLRSLAIGSSVSLSIMARAIRDAGLTNIRFRNTGTDVSFFKRIYIRRGSSPATADDRETLISNNYSLGDIEYPDLGELTISIV